MDGMIKKVSLRKLNAREPFVFIQIRERCPFQVITDPELPSLGSRQFFCTHQKMVCLVLLYMSLLHNYMQWPQTYLQRNPMSQGRQELPCLQGTEERKFHSLQTQLPQPSLILGKVEAVKGPLHWSLFSLNSETGKNYPEKSSN